MSTSSPPVYPKTSGPKIVLQGGGGGTGAVRRGGGLGKRASVPDPLFYVYFWENCWRQRRRKLALGLMGEFFFIVSPYSSMLKILRILWRLQK